MLKNLLLCFFFCFSLQLVAQPQIKTYTPPTTYNLFFEEAYALYPQIPRGLLEAVAYNQTHIRDINSRNEPVSCNGMPLPSGVMGLFENGKGVFRENLKTVSKLSGFSVNEIKNNPRINILSYAKSYVALLNIQKIESNRALEQYPILVALSELPLNNDRVDNFALDAQIYGFYTFMNDKENKKLFKIEENLDLKTFFGKNYAILSAKSIILNEAQIEADKEVYNPLNSTANRILSTDYAPAILDLTTCNYSSRSGTAISAYTIHTVQGSYAGCISWFKNCSASASSHYVVRSSDGQVTQMVLESNKAWHVGSENPYTIGTEHEGFVNDPSWYTTAMYASSADIVRDVVNSGYGINALRTFFGDATVGINTLGACVKIKGHQHFPNQTHVDPGINWNWEYFYTLVNNNPTITTFTTATGTITDPGGSAADYANDIRQCQLINPPSSSSISLTFTSFNLENNWDFLLVFNGTNNQAPLIGKYTGTVNPGTLVASSGKIYMELRTDCATTAPGFVANWTATVADIIPPTTSVNAPSTWITGDFNASFTDNDNIGIAQSYYQVIDFDGTNWQGNPNSGFMNETFTGTTIPSNWTNSTGTWSLLTNQLIQTDEANANTNLNAPLTQTNSSNYLYHFKMKIEGTGTNRRAGFHFFSDNGTMANRNNSYFVFFRNSDNKLQIYETTNDVFTLMADLPLNIPAGIEHDIKVNYNPTTGKIDVYFNNTFAGSWTDPTPLTSGTHISFRTGNCKTTFDQLSVYKSRNSTVTVTVGANKDIGYSNPSAAVSSAKIHSIVRDLSNNWSSVSTASPNIDFTIPNVIATINDGLSADISTTNNGTQLSANWTASTDANSGISNYEYAIGTTLGGTNIVNYTNCGTNLSITKTGLTLVGNQIYYISVRAKNGAGLYSTVKTSNGQTYIASCGTDIYESNETKATAKSIGSNINRTALICQNTDIDWLKFTNTSTKKNINVLLSTLPADYDLQLYNNSNVLLFSSVNAGTTNESIIYNNAPVGTYFIKIYGYNGAFHPSLNYTIRASTSSVAYRNAGINNNTKEINEENEIELDKISANITNPAKMGEAAKVNIFNYEGIANFRLFDLQGKEIMAQSNIQIERNSTNDFVIPSSLQSGLYLFFIELENQTINLKVFIN
jgi:N-acetyl-anhydromuramyl-L-alanine amidase AmpD